MNREIDFINSCIEFPFYAISILFNPMIGTVTFPVLPLTGFIFLNLFGLLECLVMCLISMPVIKF